MAERRDTRRATTLDLGRIVAGRYHVKSLIDRAADQGTKVVNFLGKDVQTGESVVVVVLKSEFTRDPDVRAAHEHGLSELGKLDHPGVSRVLAVEHDAARDELVFVKQFTAGTTVSTLWRLLEAGAVFTERQVVSIGSKLLAALAHAHERGVRFGNVKVNNILVSDGGEDVVIVGLPKPPFVFKNFLQLGAYVGFPYGCPPELLATGTFDERADVYGTGLVLYELCAGEVSSHTRKNLGTIFSEIVREPLPPVSSFNPDVSPALDKVIARAVEKDPARRFASAVEMRAALEKVPARNVPLLTHERLGRIARTALPFPIANTLASLEHQPDPAPRLSRLVDTAHVTIQLLASLVLADRAVARLPLLPEGTSRTTFARPSLGHWLAILREGTRGPLATSELKGLLADDKGRPTPAARAADALVALRNDVRHGSTLSAPMARARLEEATASLDALLAACIFLRTWELAVPRSLDFLDGEFSADAQIFRGRDTTPVPRTIRVAEPLTRARAYLVETHRRSVLPLHPLVVLHACPVCQDEEVFFYESLGDARVHYQSFQKGHTLSTDALLPAFEKLGLADPE